MAQTPNENSGTGSTPRRGNNGNRNETKKKKDDFTGAIEKMPVLQFPDERKKGSAAQYQ